MRLVDFQSGSSSALSVLYNVWENAVKSSFAEVATKYAEAQEANATMRIQCADLQQKVDLYSSVFSETIHWAQKVHKGSTQLWHIAAVLAGLFLETDKDKRKVVAESQKLREALITTRNELFTAKTTIARQREYLRHVETTPKYIEETKRAIETLQKSVNIENDERHQKAMAEIEALNHEIESMREQEKQREEKDAEVIEGLKKEIEDLKSELHLKDNECERLQKKCDNRAKKIEALQAVETRVKELEKAVNEHCHINPFIGFDGTRFLYKIGSVPQQSALEFELDATRKQCKKFEDEKKNLKTQIERMEAKFISELQRTRATAESEQTELINAREVALSERDSAIEKEHILALKCQKLEKANRSAEEHIKKLNERLQQKERKSEVVDAIAKYQEELSALAGTRASSKNVSLAPLNTQPLDIKAIVQESEGVLRTKVNDLEREKEQLITENNLLKMELRGAQQKSKTLNEELEVERNERARASTSVDEMRKRNKSLLAQLPRVGSTPLLAPLEPEVGGSHEHSDGLSGKADVAMSAENEKLRHENEELHTKLTKLTEGYDKYRAEEESKHQEEVKELRNQIDNLKRQKAVVRFEPLQHHPEPETEEPTIPESKTIEPDEDETNA